MCYLQEIKRSTFQYFFLPIFFYVNCFSLSVSYKILLKSKGICTGHRKNKLIRPHLKFYGFLQSSKANANLHVWTLLKKNPFPWLFSMDYTGSLISTKSYSGKAGSKRIYLDHCWLLNMNNHLGCFVWDASSCLQYFKANFHWDLSGMTVFISLEIQIKVKMCLNYQTYQYLPAIDN